MINTRVQNLCRRFSQFPCLRKQVYCFVGAGATKQASALRSSYRFALHDKSDYIGEVRNQLLRLSVSKSPIKCIHKIEGRMPADELKWLLFDFVRRLVWRFVFHC